MPFLWPYNETAFLSRKSDFGVPSVLSTLLNPISADMASLRSLRVARRCGPVSLARLQRLPSQATAIKAPTGCFALRLSAQHQVRTVAGHARIQNPPDTANFIDNKLQASETKVWYDVHDPATNNVVTRVPQTTRNELEAAVKSAQDAFPSWKATSLLTRQSIMFNFVSLIKENRDRLAESITREQGKTFEDAKGDVLRGLQVAETACGITTQLTGDILPVAKDMVTHSIREPLGVVAAICPFSESLFILLPA